MAKALTNRILKATSLLSSTQVLNMLCSVVRTKLLSVWLGELGVGLMGALTQTGDFIGNVTQLNMRTTAVRDLAASTPAMRSRIIVCIRRYGLLLGLGGAAIMSILAPWLSQFIFSHTDYAMAFRIASLSLLFISLQGSELIVLQGSGLYAPIAASGLTTALAGLLIAIPLFWLLNDAGVPFAILGYSLTAWLAARWYARRHRAFGPAPSWRQSLALGRGFIATGALLTLTSLVNDGVNFAFLGIIGQHGKDVLGHFQAGYTMLWRYAAVLFMSFAIEFYPRLSRAGHSRRATSLMLTHQGVIFTLLAIPFAAAAILLAPWLIRLLFRESFMPLLPYFVWGMAGMAMRPLSVAMSYSFLAAARGKVYAITEIISGLVAFGLYVAGFTVARFTGLGIAVIAWLMADLLIMLAAARIVGAPMPRTRAIVAALLSPLPLLPLAAFVAAR